jgi:hypothetical protein
LGLITVLEFKALPLGLPDKVFDKIGDPALQIFIDTASTQVANHCSRQLESAEIEQEMDGNGDYVAVLREYPVTELASVEWEDDLGTTGTEDVTKLRVSSSGIIRWVNKRYGPFLRSRRYTVTYTAGYEVVPGPIKHATAIWTTELLQPVYNQGAAGKPATLIELSSEQIAELLEDYRRKGVRG